MSLNEKAGYKRGPPRTKVINFERTWRCTNFALWSFLSCERMNSMHKSAKRDAFSSAESRDSHKKAHEKFQNKTIMADNTEPCSLPQQPRKKRARHGVRYQMELNFDSDEGRFSFLSRLDSAKRTPSAGQ